MVENGQAYCGKGNCRKASSNKRLHGMLPLRYSFWLYSKKLNCEEWRARGGFMELLIVRC
jgi:hypothetical protein